MSAEGYCEIGGCGHEADGSVIRNNAAGRLRLCAGHLQRWLTAAAMLATELRDVAGRRQRVAANGNVAVVAARVEQIGMRLGASPMAGPRPQPGTAKALAKLGPEHERQRSRRRP